MTFVYLHGFASSPASRKAQYFAGQLRAEGAHVVVPQLESDGFRGLTVSGQLKVIESAAGAGPVRLIGSSMGGYLAALHASLNRHVDRVLLLAPAFGFAQRWPLLLGEEKMREWKTNGSIEMMHYTLGRMEPVGYGLIEDGLKYPAEPNFMQPAQIYHGVNDEVVPVQFSRDFARTHPNAVLTEMKSGHELTDVMDDIWRSARSFLLEA